MTSQATPPQTGHKQDVPENGQLQLLFLPDARDKARVCKELLCEAKYTNYPIAQLSNSDVCANDVFHQLKIV